MEYKIWEIKDEEFKDLEESEVKDYICKKVQDYDEVNLKIDNFRGSDKYGWLKDYVIPQLIREKKIGYNISSDIETFSYANSMLSGYLKGTPDNWEV